VKNKSSRNVRNWTFRPDDPETRDRRVRKTRSSLHGALITLAHEKPYDSIAVKEILDRADVARSTFYTHFGDKDELLDSGIHALIQSFHRQRSAGAGVEGVVSFSLPFLEHIDGHRHARGRHMTRNSRLVMHEHLQTVLADDIAEGLRSTRFRAQAAGRIPAELAARHLASTFVLVLNWWTEREPALTPLQVDARFRQLVLPWLANL
jgi:AcrR family transcriptional regulator